MTTQMTVDFSKDVMLGMLRKGQTGTQILDILNVIVPDETEQLFTLRRVNAPGYLCQVHVQITVWIDHEKHENTERTDHVFH